MARRRVVVRLVNSRGGLGSSASVAFFDGSSEASVKRAAAASLSLSPAVSPARVQLFEDETQTHHWNPAYPTEEAVVRVLPDTGDSAEDPDASADTLRSLHSSGALGSFDEDRANYADSIHSVMSGPGQTDLPSDDRFRGQYVKFERVLSHLANERTWLAWMRAALTLLSSAFTLWRIYAAIDSGAFPVISQSLYFLVLGYMIVIPLTVIVGYVRFEQTKQILGMDKASLSDHFGSLGVNLQAGLLFCVMLLTVGCYWSLGDYYVFRR